MPVVKFFVCLGVFTYLTSNENPIKSTDSFIFRQKTGKMAMYRTLKPKGKEKSSIHDFNNP